MQPGYRVGRKVLVRADTAGGTHEFVDYLHRRRLSYSVGFFVSDTNAAALDPIPETPWTPAYDADGQVRDGAWVAEATGVLDLADWPDGMAGDREKSARTLAPSCASPTATGCGSPRSPPTPPVGNCPTSNCATAVAPAARTASTSRKTPACKTFRCTASIRTRSGARSCNSPWNSPHGCRCSPCTAMRRGGGNPNDCGYDCSRSPYASHVTPAEPGSASPHMPHGPSYSPWLWPDSNQPDQHESIQPSRKDREPGDGTRQNPLTGRPRTPQPRKTSSTSQSENRQATPPEKDPGLASGFHHRLAVLYLQVSQAFPERAPRGAARSRSRTVVRPSTAARSLLTQSSRPDCFGARVGGQSSG